MSKVMNIEIKAKGELVGTLEYTYPENLKEAVEMDGKDKVFALYSAQRKIKARDAERTKLTGGGGLSRAVTSALKSADPEVVAKVMAMLKMEE